jgi:O-antigen/teichoic acid export membrane protein
MTSLGTNVVANLIGRAWPSLLGILFVPLYLRFMGIEAYGLVGFYATLQGVLGLLDLGIGSTMTRELARLSVVEDSNQKQRDLVRTLEILYWLIALAAGITIVLIAPLLAQHWINAQQMSPEQLTTVIQLMGLAVALQFPFALYQGGLMGLQHQVLVNAVLTVVGTLRAGGAVVVLWLVSPSITAFMGWQVIAGLVGSFTFMGLLWRNLPKHEKHAKFDLAIMKGLWRYAITVAANGMVGVAITQTDKIILSTMLSLTQFGYYSLATTLASAIWMIIVPFNNSVFPRFVQLYQNTDNDGTAKLLHSASQYLSLLMLPVAAILAIFSGDILLLWTNDSLIAEGAKNIAMLLVIGTTINGMCSIPAYAASAFGWPQLVMTTNFLVVILAFPLIYLSTSKWGAVGAAAVWIGINSVYIMIMVPVFFSKYLCREKVSWYVTDQITPAFLAISISIFYYTTWDRDLHQGTITHLAATWASIMVVSTLALPAPRRAFANAICKQMRLIH